LDTATVNIIEFPRKRLLLQQSTRPPLATIQVWIPDLCMRHISYNCFYSS